MPRPNHRRPALRIGWVALPISLLLTTYACRAPTEMTVRITTEVPCSALRGVGIVVAPDSFVAEERARAKYFAAETNHCDSEAIVGTLVLTPGSDSLAVIVVAGIDRPSSACQPPDYAGCVVARRRLAFVEHTSLDVPVVITRDCLDVPCDTQTSCVHGNCKSSETSCDGDSCTQVASRADGGPDDEGSADTGADTAPAEGRCRCRCRCGRCDRRAGGRHLRWQRLHVHQQPGLRGAERSVLLRRPGTPHVERAVHVDAADLLGGRSDLHVLDRRDVREVGPEPRHLPERDVRRLLLALGF